MRSEIKLLLNYDQLHFMYDNVYISCMIMYNPYFSMRLKFEIQFKKVDYA